jgi:SAM-dependent methyltransferase
MNRAICTICGSEALSHLTIRGSCLIFNCRDCGVHFARYETDSRSKTHERADPFRGVDLEKYERSVRATREASYCQLLSRVRTFVQSGNWLDVGCSFGWLLCHVQQRGFAPFGVEPSPGAVASARKAGLSIAEGLYPAVSGDGAPYAVISFMDVLEHMPEPSEMLASARELLSGNGIIVLQIPDQSCLLYGIAICLHRLTAGRIDFALRRLWLTDQDYPHLFYMNKRSMTRLLARCGYEILDCHRTAIGQLGSAADRVGYMSRGTSASVAVIAAATGAINAIDNRARHGGLLTLIARPRRGASTAGFRSAPG